MFVLHVLGATAKLGGLSTTAAGSTIVRGKQSPPIFTLSEGGVIQKKLTTTQTNSWQTLTQQQQQQQPVRKTVKIVRLNPGVTVSRPQSIPATIIPSPLKKSVVSIAPKIVRAQDLKTETIGRYSSK